MPACLAGLIPISLSKTIHRVKKKLVIYFCNSFYFRIEENGRIDFISFKTVKRTSSSMLKDKVHIKLETKVSFSFKKLEFRTTVRENDNEKQVTPCT